MNINEYLTNNENYFSFIDKDYLEELDLATDDLELKKDFKIAYLVLFFQLSSGENFEKSVLLGDLFISILTKRLVKRNHLLLLKITEAISYCHCECILWKVKCYKRRLLKILEEDSYDNKVI